MFFSILHFFPDTPFSTHQASRSFSPLEQQNKKIKTKSMRKNTEKRSLTCVDQLATPEHVCIEPAIKCDWFIPCHSIEDNWFSLPQNYQLETAFWVVREHWAHILSMMGFCLSRACVSFYVFCLSLCEFICTSNLLSLIAIHYHCPLKSSYLLFHINSGACMGRVW